MGTLYGGRWKVVESIGEGGQAHAFRVRDVQDDTDHWILKKLKNRRRLGRFEQEVGALQRLKSEHIPDIVDFSLDDPAFLVTRDGGMPLPAYCRESRSLETLLLLFRDVVLAVRDAHRIGVVHRDIKPDNVVVNPGRSVGQLVDFGICQYLDDTPVYLTRVEAFGNAAFSAPECALGREVAPGRPADIYSLGKVLYWLISGGGHINREAITPTVIAKIDTDNPVVRSTLTDLLRKTVLEHPGGRWSADELLKGLDDALERLQRIRTHEKRGERLLLDRFPIADDWAPSGSKSASTAPRGNPPGRQDVAMAFEVPAGPALVLRSLVLALHVRAGSGRAVVQLVPDGDGEPDMDASVELFRAQVGRTRVERLVLESAVGPELRPGGWYWVVLAVEGSGAEIAWWTAGVDLVPSEARIGKWWDGKWRCAVSKGGPGYALRVVAAERCVRSARSPGGTQS